MSPRAKSKPAFSPAVSAEISAQAHQVDAAVVLVDIREDLEGVVTAAVVHKNSFRVRIAEGVHYFSVSFM